MVILSVCFIVPQEHHASTFQICLKGLELVVIQNKCSDFSFDVALCLFRQVIELVLVYVTHQRQINDPRVFAFCIIPNLKCHLKVADSCDYGLDYLIHTQGFLHH